MAWARYDDELPMNRKVAALLAQGVFGAAALGLHVLANTWSRHNGTAGMVPRYVPGQLVGDAKLGVRLSLLLANVGMFDTIEMDGWLIHDFDDYSDPNDDGRPASEKKRDISAKRAAAGRAGGLAKAQQTSGKSVRLPEQTSGPVPVPVPIVQVGDNSTTENTPCQSSSSIASPTEWRLKLSLLLSERSKTRTGSVDGYAVGIRARLNAERNRDLDAWYAEGVTPEQAADIIDPPPERPPSMYPEFPATPPPIVEKLSREERAARLATVHRLHGATG